MKILVTDGNNRASLAITRSLGKKGHYIVVGAETQPSLASSSKYCRDSFEYPSPVNTPDNFLGCLIDTVKEKSIDVLLPVSDVTTIPVTKHKNKFGKFCRVPFSEYHAVSLAADKARLFALAGELDIPIPETFTLDKYDGNLEIPANMCFPLVIKPCRSRILTESGWLSTAVSYASDKDQLEKILTDEHPLAFPILIQERITGPGIGVFTCYNKGQPIVFFSHKRLREKPPSGGVSVLRESIAVPDTAKVFSERLLNQLGWHGVAMVEFKLDTRDNLPKLMEINGRFWGSLQLAIDAGVDFPNLLVDTISNNDIESLKDYEKGVKTRWLLGDIDSLLLVLFRSRAHLNLPIGHRGRLRYLIEFMKLWDRNMHYEVLSRDDFKPWLYELKSWIKR